MKLSEFMTCWRECVPSEYPIDIEQLKVVHLKTLSFHVHCKSNFRDMLLFLKIQFLSSIQINLVKKSMNESKHYSLVRISGHYLIYNHFSRI